MLNKLAWSRLRDSGERNYAERTLVFSTFDSHNFSEPGKGYEQTSNEVKVIDDL